MAGWRFRGIKAAIVIMIFMVIIINTSAAPLEVSIEERVNSTIDTNGVGSDGTASFTYSTDVKGSIIVKNNASEDIMDIWVAVDLKNVTGNSCQGSYVVSSVPAKITSEGGFYSGANCYIHIPLLEAGQSVVAATYDVDDSAMGIDKGAPFIVEEKYDPAKIPKGGDYTWTVYFNVTLNDTWWGNTALGTPSSVTLTVNKNLNTSYDSNWLNLEFADGSFNPKTIISSATLSKGSWENVSFKVKGNYSSNEAFVSRLVGFGEAYFQFGPISGNISGTKIIDVFAIGDADISVNKSGPFGPDENQWKGNVTIKNTASGLTYVVKAYRIWATDRDDYSEIESVVNNSVNENIGPGDVYKSYDDLTFTYDEVPIIWGNVTFKLAKDDNTGWGVGQDNIKDGGNTYVIERIYVIGSYLVKVTKHVESAGNDVYNITLVVENLGGEKSPFVYVYDMIPKNFSRVSGDDDWTTTGDAEWVNKSSMFAGNGSVDNPMSGYKTGYWWRLNPLEGGADGDGAYNDYQEIEDNKSVVIFYQIQGSGDYKLLDAFIVGIDPILSMNEQTSPKITLVSGAKATSYESVMALATALVGLTAVVSYRKRS